MHNLSNSVYTSLLSTGVAASDTSTDWNHSGLDMRGFEGVRFIVGVDSTSTGASNAHVEMAATSSFASAIDVNASAAYLTTGFTTSQATAVLVTDVFRPTYRWVRLMVDRATTGESVAFALAEQYRAGLLPQSYSTAVNIADVQISLGTSGTATG